MIKLLPFILCICLAIASGFLWVLGNQAIEENARVVEVKELESGVLLSEPPGHAQKMLINNFRWGPHVSKMDFDDDGNWDELFAVIFPTTIKQKKTRYKGILINLGGVKNQEELDKFLEQEELEIYYSPGLDFSEYAYANLAKRYKSMDFRKSVVVQANHPELSNQNAELFLLAGQGGLALSGILFVVVLLYKVIKRILPKRKVQDAFDEVPQPTRNKAGLPSI